MINKRVRTRKKLDPDDAKVDKSDRFMIKYMGIDWFLMQKRKSETIFILCQEEESIKGKNCQS